jgi:hypothetical protein
MTKRGEVTQATVGLDDDVTPAPSVAAVGTATRNVSLAPEADAAIATSAGLDMNGDAVVQHGFRA